MKGANFWVFLFGFVLTTFCGSEIAHRVFGLSGVSSVVGTAPFTGYSVGLILTSIACVTPRIKALEEKVAGLSKRE
jgi:hypothetical protein